MNYTTNENLKQLTEKTLIIGIDIAKQIHVARAIDFRGMLLDHSLKFSNNISGFRKLIQWIHQLKLLNKKTDLIVGMEPTGHYGFNIAAYLNSVDIHTVFVLGIQVNRSKEIADNIPSKNDFKDALIIANLVKDGHYKKQRTFQPPVYELKEAMAFYFQLTKNIVRIKNQIHNFIDIYFPEFREAFKDINKKTALATLQLFPLPHQILQLSNSDIVNAWRDSGILRGIGLRKAQQLRRLADQSVGLKQGLQMATIHIDSMMQQYQLFHQQREELWFLISSLLDELPQYEQIMQIPDIGPSNVAFILSEIGDIHHFSHPKQLSRLAGLNLKESSSGFRKGNSEITKRGRPKLRRSLYFAVLNLLKNKTSPFYRLHLYYTTRNKNPLRPMQSVIALCNKLLRVIFGIVKHGRAYDPQMVLKYIPASFAD